MKELKALLKILRQNGVTFYKTADLELNITADFLMPAVQDGPISEALEPTDDQLMYYSVSEALNEDIQG